MKLEIGRLEQNFSSDSSLTEQFIDRYFTLNNSLRFKVIFSDFEGWLSVQENRFFNFI